MKRFHLCMDLEEPLLFKWATRNLLVFSLCWAVFICTFSCVCSHACIRTIGQCQCDFPDLSLPCFFFFKAESLIETGCYWQDRLSSKPQISSCFFCLLLWDYRPTQPYSDFFVSGRYPNYGPFACAAISLQT